MRARNLLLLLVAAGTGIAGMIGGCGGSETSSGGDGGEGGTSSNGSTVSSTVSSNAAVTSTGSSSTATVPLGDVCEADTDCKDSVGGRCLKSSDNNTFLGGGPANGYCTKDCAKDEDCPGVTSVCVKQQGEAKGSCFLGCEFGDPPNDFIDTPLDEDKCYGREDLRCQKVNNNALCIPTCGKDEQCGTRKCDPALSVCVDTPTTGKTLGSACDPDAKPSECAGVCIGFTQDDPNAPPITMCSSLCVLGGELDGNDCGGLDKGLCVFSPSANGAGDYGFCTAACSAHDQCQNPIFWCTPIGLTSGYCFGHDACKVQADCKGKDEVCTDTKYGRYCISDKYPLGSSAPGDGGPGDGGPSDGGVGGGGADGGMGVGGAGGN